LSIIGYHRIFPIVSQKPYYHNQKITSLFFDRLKKRLIIFSS